MKLRRKASSWRRRSISGSPSIWLKTAAPTHKYTTTTTNRTTIRLQPGPFDVMVKGHVKRQRSRQKNWSKPALLHFRFIFNPYEHVRVFHNFKFMSFSNTPNLTLLKLSIYITVWTIFPITKWNVSSQSNSFGEESGKKQD